MVRIGMTHEEVISILGKPDEIGGTSRKYKTPSICKYGDIELHFKPGKTGLLWMAYCEDEQGEGVVLLGGTGACGGRLTTG